MERIKPTMSETDDGVQYPAPLDSQSILWLRKYLAQLQKERQDETDRDMRDYFDGEIGKYSRLLAEIDAPGTDV